MDLVYDAPFGGTTIRQIRGTDFSQNVQKFVERYSGGLDPQLIAVLSAEPKINVRTGNLACLSSISPTTGLAVTSSGTIVFPWQARASGSTFVSGSNHYSLSSTLGLIIPQTITASQDAQEGATLALEFMAASSDGATNPVAINGSVALASQAFVASHGLGPVVADGTTIGGLKSSTVTFGLSASTDRYSGLPFAGIDGIFLGERDPMLEIEFENKATAVTLGMLSAATTVIAYYRKFADGSTRVTNNTSEHVAVTFSGGLKVFDSSGGQGVQNASNKYTVHAKTVSVSTTAQIP